MQLQEEQSSKLCVSGQGVLASLFAVQNDCAQSFSGDLLGLRAGGDIAIVGQSPRLLAWKGCA